MIKPDAQRCQACLLSLPVALVAHLKLNRSGGLFGNYGEQFGWEVERFFARRTP